MKKFLKIAIVLIAFGFSGCEKDDICASTTPTTPRLVINFYDRSNTDAQKNVVNLKVVGEGETNGIIFNESAGATEITKYLTNANTISLPLRLNAETTTYALTLYANDNDLANTDTISFNYSKNQIYVSRACGYKTNFRLNTENPVVRPIDDTNEWISNITVETTNIETENETHIKIYF